MTESPHLRRLSGVRSAVMPHTRLFTLISVILLACTVLASPAQAHATLVFGTMETSPLDAHPIDGFSLILHMMDPVRTPIEDATVHAEFRYWPEGLEEPPEDAQWHIYRMVETGPGGNYEAQVVLPDIGRYELIMRDTTYPQEDAIAELEVLLDGSEPHDELLFVFPPTDIGAASLGTWLIWLIGIPVVAGITVTVIVLRGGGGEKKAAK